MGDSGSDYSSHDDTAKIYVSNGEDAPQVYQQYDNKEVFRGCDTKEVHLDRDNKEVALSHEKEITPSNIVSRNRPWWKKKRVMAVAAVVLILAIVGGVLGGVFGTKKSDPSSVSEPSEPTAMPLPSSSGDAGQASANPSSISTNPSSTSKATSSVSRAFPSPTSIKRGSMFAATSFRDEAKEETDVFLVYQTPSNDFQLARYNKSDKAKKGTWDHSISFANNRTARDLSGLGISLVEGGGLASGIDYLCVNTVDSTNILIVFCSDAKPDELQFGPEGGGDNTWGGWVAQKSNLARYGNYLIYQDNEGIVHLHFIMSTEKNNWRNLDVEASKGTKLGIIPLFRDYSKTMDRLSADNFTNPFNEIALGVFYIDSSSHLAAAKVGNDGEDPFRNFPHDITISPSGSFTAFAVTAADKEHYMVDIYIIYREASSDFKQLWTEDGGMNWRTSSPEALKGGDIGSTITCTSLETVDQEGSRILQPVSAGVSCYFLKDGYMVEAEYNGKDWTLVGDIPLG